MARVPVPASLTLRSSGRWALRPVTASPGPGLDGRQQWVRREARVWTGDVQVRGAWLGDGWGAYLAFLDELAGPANTFRVPVCNGRTPVAASGEILFVLSDGKFAFVDGTSNLYVLDEGNPTVATAAPAGATILQLTGTEGSSLVVGSYFSVDDFLHRVAANESASVGSGSVRFNPPLRKAVAVGVAVQVAAPTIRVRLMDDASAEDAYRSASLGAPFVLSVVEAFER